MCRDAVRPKAIRILPQPLFTIVIVAVIAIVIALAESYRKHMHVAVQFKHTNPNTFTNMQILYNVGTYENTLLSKKNKHRH